MARASSGALAQPSEAAAGQGANGQGDRADASEREGASEGLTPERISFELLALAGLLLLTGAFGRTFSKLELGFSWLHPTEVVLAAVLGVALVRIGPQDWVQRIRKTGALVPLLVLWAFGAVATLRGLVDWGFAHVLYDIGLVEYSVLVPLVAVIARDRLQFSWLCRVVVLAGLLAMVVHLATIWTPLEWGLSDAVNLILPASGLCVALFVLWPLAQRAAGIPVAPWQYPAAALGMALIVLGLTRAVWVGMAAALFLVVAFSPPGRRLASAGALAALLVLGVAVSIPVDALQPVVPPAPLAEVERDVADAEPRTSKPREGNRDVGSVPPGEAPGGAGQEGPMEPSRPGDAPKPLDPGGEQQAEPKPERPPDARPAGRPGGADVPAAGESLFENPGIELGEDGYSTFGANTLAVTRRVSRTGSYSLEATYENDPRLVQTATYLPLAADVQHSLAAWVYIPQGWDGGAVALSTDGTWAGAEEESTSNTTAAKGAWVRLHATVTPDSEDLIGAVSIRADSEPSPGKAAYIDDVVISPPGLGVPRQSNDPITIGQDGVPTPPEELEASFGSSTAQAANASWRLAFWKYMLEESARRPVFGAGFGRPSNFEWSGVFYDRRLGNPLDPFDVTGPHNSFINLLYRTGLPGFLALAAIMFLGLRGVGRIALRASGADRARAIWLLAALAISTGVASFTVALEGPFMGVFFWTLVALGLLAPQALAATKSARPAPEGG